MEATFTQPRGTIRGPGGVYVKLDAREIFPDDPGNGTPAMVYAPFGQGCSTFWCVCSVGELDGYELSEAQSRWLDSLEVAIDQWLSIWTSVIKRDGRDAMLALCGR